MQSIFSELNWSNHFYLRKPHKLRVENTSPIPNLNHLVKFCSFMEEKTQDTIEHRIINLLLIVVSLLFFFPIFFYVISVFYTK